MQKYLRFFVCFCVSFFTELTMHEHAKFDMKCVLFSFIFLFAFALNPVKESAFVVTDLYQDKCLWTYSSRIQQITRNRVSRFKNY